MLRLPRVVTALVSLASLATVACDQAFDPGRDPDPGGARDEVAVVEAPYSGGYTTTNYAPPLVRFQLAGRWHTGMLLLPPGQSNGSTNLVLTTSRNMPWVNEYACEPAIVVEKGFASTRASSQNVETANVIHWLGFREGLLLLLLDRSLAVTNAPVMATALPTTNAAITCMGYNPYTVDGNLNRFEGTGGPAAGRGFRYRDPINQDLDGEDGFVCMNQERTTIFGLSEELDPSGDTRVHALHPYTDWMNAQLALVALVQPNQYQRGELVPNRGRAMVMDIPSSSFADVAVNQYTENYGLNQRFYWKRVDVVRNGLSVARWLMINRGSGKCVTNSAGAGVRQEPCSVANTRQLWERVSTGVVFPPPRTYVDVQLKNDFDGRCVVAPASASVGTQLAMQACNAGAQYRDVWRLPMMVVQYCAP